MRPGTPRSWIVDYSVIRELGRPRSRPHDVDLVGTPFCVRVATSGSVADASSGSRDQLASTARTRRAASRSIPVLPLISGAR